MTDPTPSRDYSRFDRFCDRIAGEVYPEPPSGMHTQLTRDVIQNFLSRQILKAGDKILDVGCGQGVALEMFRQHGLNAIGVTLGPDAEVCTAKGFDVRQADQNFMTFADGEFDFLWCRHVLEHSIAPFFTVNEYKRVTKAGGYVYVEVPAPDTSAQHGLNPNHYSVLPLSGWKSLFERCGLEEQNCIFMNFNLPCGPDTYWGFLLRVPA